MKQKQDNNQNKENRVNKLLILVCVLIVLIILVGLLTLFMKSNRQNETREHDDSSIDSSISFETGNVDGTELKSTQTSINNVVGTTITEPIVTDVSASISTSSIITTTTKIEREYTDWGEWSDWSETPISETELIRVETKNEIVKEIIGYNMYHFITRSTTPPYIRIYRDFSVNNDFDLYEASPSYGEHNNVKEIDLETFNNATEVLSGTFFEGQYAGYNMANVTGYSFPGDDSYLWFKGEPVTKDYTVTKYRYCERSTIEND